jgi:hypothetical protein
MERLRDLGSRCPAIAHVRGQGLMIGFDFAPPGRDDAEELANSFMLACRRDGLHLTFGYGGVNFRVIPPLTLTCAEIDFAIGVMEAAAREVLLGKKSGPDYWPVNPYTRRLFENRGWKRYFTYFWKSSPQQLLEKGRELVRSRFGADA